MLSKQNSKAWFTHQRIENGLFEVVAVPDTSLASRLKRNPQLTDADIAVLAYAAVSEGTAVMDEKYGRDVAATEDITIRGTAYIVLLIARRNAISVDEARTTIDAVVDEGWYCTPDLYAKIVRTLDSLRYSCT